MNARPGDVHATQAQPEAQPRACPVCGGKHTLPFLDRENVPVHQNLVLPNQASAVAVSLGDLAMQVCKDCGFVFNAAFDLARLSYGRDYDNTQSHSAVFDAYLDKLVEQMVHQHGVRNARIVEVGCGKGHFLRKLVAYPGAGNTGFGFDPSYVGPETDLDGALQFRRSFYDGTCADVPADVVVCRHVIEHVPAPVQLLGAVRAALVSQPAARVFFETPCVEWILRNKVVWDFFYEHCSLFSRDSLRHAFEATGFVVHGVEHVFGDQYLWLHAGVAPSAPHSHTAQGADGVAALAEAYGRSLGELCLRWRARLAGVRLLGPVALWGAGAKGVTLAHLVDPEREWIDCLVDINPAKQGCFVPGSGHPIVAPAALLSRQVANVILMNPNYARETVQWLEAERCPAKLLDWS